MVVGDNTGRRNVLKYGGAATLTGLAGCLGLDSSSGSGDYPSETIRVVVPYGEGGGTDIYTRQIAPKMGDILGTSVNVENIPGAGTIRGTNEVFNADPDGYTICFTNGPQSKYLLTPDEVPFDPTAMKPVGKFASTGFVLSAHPDDNVEGYEDLISRYQNGELENFGVLSVGGGQWLVANLLKDYHGLEFDSLVSYESSGAICQANASKEIGSGIPTETTLEQFASDGTLDPIVATYSEGSPSLPDVPSVTDAGYDAIPYGRFDRGVLAPPETPDDIVTTLEEALVEACESDEIQSWSEETGNVILPGDRGAFRESWIEAGETLEEEVDMEKYRQELEE